MIRVYFLPVNTINGTEVVAGIEYIHDALLDATEEPNIRKLTQNTTPEEQLGLSDVAIEDRDATPEEIDRYNAQVIIISPDPDTMRAQEILSNPAVPIPAPDLAELVRIFGRRLGYDF